MSLWVYKSPSASLLAGKCRSPEPQPMTWQSRDVERDRKRENTILIPRAIEAFIVPEVQRHWDHLPGFSDLYLGFRDA